jgi:hypothetical protein
MMARSRVRINSAGARAVLNSTGVVAATQAAAEAVAENARDQDIKVGDRDGGKFEYDLPVTVKMFTTDRPHAVVALAHPAGDSVQAKNGTLTKAAGQAGLDVRSK